MNFRFYVPTKIFIGRNCIIENAELFKTLGTKALLVTGRNSAKTNGSQDDVLCALNKVGIDFAVFDKVDSNPSIENIDQGAELARNENIDFIIGIGGGSPLDAAKSIAILATNHLKAEELFRNDYTNKPLPIVAIPTTAGTGSEVTPYSIITNPKAQTKTNVSNESLFPRIAFLDAKYMQNLPLNTTINTAIDALSHSVEGFLSKRATPLTDIIAKEGISLFGQNLDELLKGELSYALRENLLFSSCLGGMVVANTGTTILHPMGYSLTYFRSIDHGRANGLLMHKYLEYMHEASPEKVMEVLRLTGVGTLNNLEITLDNLLKEKEKISDEEAILFASIAINAKNMKNTPRILSQSDMEKIYKESLR